MASIKVGIMGLGTVGRGTLELLLKSRNDIKKKLGREIEVFIAAARSIEKVRSICPPSTIATHDPFDVVEHPEVDIVLELIGGSTIARELVIRAISNGKAVVTANKKLLAEYGNEIFSLAEKKGVSVRYEAAVAGGIPIIKVLREALVANQVNEIAGIINGTSNFILTQMRKKGTDFATALKEAQALGYAEADPTFDIEGQDAGHKITLMAALAFGIPLDFSHCYLEGISHLHGEDIQYANMLGYRVKLLALTKRRTEGVELRVHPTLLPKEQLLAHVEGVMNAVYVDSSMLGKSLYYGSGAGALPTASSVVADVIDSGRELGNKVQYPIPHLTYKTSEIQPLPFLSINDIESSYYLRLRVKDRVGVLSCLTKIFSEHDVSIALMQQPKEGGNSESCTASILILTHKAIERQVKAAISKIEELEVVLSSPIMLRIENLA